MANIILVLGKSGAGKSCSIQTLDPKSTLVINPLKKDLPFKGSKKLYNTENKNYFEPSFSAIYDHTKKMLAKVNTELTDIKTVVIDDATYFMRSEVFATAQVKGFEKFAVMAKNLHDFLAQLQELRSDLNIFVIWHPDVVMSDQSISTYAPSLSGKMIEEKYNPLECCSICLFADVKLGGEEPQYIFYTNRTLAGTIEIPAKSPKGMFPLEIPNDMQKVIEGIKAYYE